MEVAEKALTNLPIEGQCIATIEVILLDECCPKEERIIDAIAALMALSKEWEIHFENAAKLAVSRYKEIEDKKPTGDITQ